MRFSTMLHTSILLLPFAIAPVGAALAQDTSTPEASATSTIEAMAASDWTTMTDLMHPDALNELRDLFVPLLQHPDMGELRVEMFGITTVEEVADLSGADVYQELIQFTLGLNPDIMELVSTATLDVIGHVMEDDVAHVVYRLHMTVEELHIAKTAVTSFKQLDGRWLGMLSGDLRGIIAGLQQMLE